MSFHANNFKYDNVILLCPSAITGGPEAIHQLSFIINDLGGKSTIAYFGDQSHCELNNDYISCSNPPSLIIENYAKYKPIFLKSEKITESTLVIFPEVLCEIAKNVNFPSKAIWWLSVDNAFIFNPGLEEDIKKKNFFKKNTAINFFQSEYARDFLVSNGAEKIAPLFDYVDRLYLKNVSIKKRTAISIYPKKGRDFATNFIAQNKDLNIKLIEGMKINEVISVLEESIINIDFGHHPGKDRGPRESSASNVIVFLNNEGAAKNAIDYPIDDYFKFSIDDIDTGLLANKVRSALKNPNKYLSQQAFFKDKISLEQQEFKNQVETFFFEKSK